MTDLDSFRSETRAWLEANCPPEMRQPMRSEADACWGGRNWTFQSDAQRQWLEAMAGRGWTVPDWPKDYGGGGLSPAETRVLKEEMQRIGARPPLASFGISMLGPALLEYGTEEQKKHYLAADRARRNPLVPGLFASRARGRTSPACRPRPRTRATTGWSTARRSGPAMPTRPTGSSAWCGRRPSPSKAGSASCCSTWRRRASRPGRSC